MSKRTSITNLRMRSSEDRFFAEMLHHRDVDEVDPSAIKVISVSKLPKCVRDGIKNQCGRSAMFCPDDRDDIGWVPEKLAHNGDPKFYSKWFNRTQK